MYQIGEKVIVHDWYYGRYTGVIVEIVPEITVQDNITVLPQRYKICSEFGTVHQSLNDLSKIETPNDILKRLCTK